MGNTIETLGAQMAGQAAGGIMGMVLGGINDKRQRKQQEELQRLQIEGQKEMGDYNFKRQMELWRQTNYEAQVEQMKKAGLNPALMYGMSGGGGATTATQGGNVTGATAQQNPGDTQTMMGMGMQLPLIMAQKELIEAEKEKAETETTKIGGVDTQNVIADTENKILNKIILEYTGKDAQRTFDKIKQPNTAIESETYMKELEAKQGIAGTIYDMWLEGKLADKATGEVEQVLLQNAKTRAEKMEIMSKIDMLEQNIKGAKLDNIIKDLETRLQTETGIDRNSPAWLKILGRLFVQLLNK